MLNPWNFLKTGFYEGIKSCWVPAPCQCNRIDRYRAELGLDDDDESFSEQGLVNHFKGESLQMRRYVLDRVRDGITTHPDNKLREYIEYGGRSTGKPLSYSAVENTFYQFFIYRQVLTTPFNYRFQEGANPRQTGNRTNG